MTSITINAFIVWTADVTRAAAFYRALGVALVDEQHPATASAGASVPMNERSGSPAGALDDGPLHAAADVAGVHVAIYPAPETARAPAYRTTGAAMLGVEVASLSAVLAAVGDAPILRGPEDMPWGRRVVLADPDGRPVEVTERSHSDAG
jgi:lactoylglutathione lyase